MKPDEPAQNAVLAGLSESPFARLRALLDIPTSQTDPISLAVGSPRHKPPQFALDCLTDNLASYGDYPPINGIEPWQTSARDWLARRFQLLPEIYGAPHQVIPATGTREALFLAAQIAPEGPNKKFMAMPNPFYQLYAAATLSAGATPLYMNAVAENGFLPDPLALSDETLDQMRAVFMCSPANPQGAIANWDYLDQWLARAERHNFLLIMDECYIDIFDRRHEASPPISALNVAAQRKEGLKNLMVFHSLSKRSSLPGLRSGLGVGGEELMKQFLKLRMLAAPQSPIAAQKAAALCWANDAHVQENRSLYQDKIDLAEDVFGANYNFYRPEGGFFLWLDVGDSEAITKLLWEKGGIRVLPGAYLGAEVNGENPGAQYIRVALVGDMAEMKLALPRMHDILSAEGIK